MVEGNVPTAEWPTYSLQQLFTPIMEAKAAKKYLFLWDKQGNVATFMQYKASLAPLGPEMVKVALGRQENKDVGEYIRRMFVHGMRQGENLCLDMDETRPNFSAMDTDCTFKADQFFKFEEFSKEESYLP